MHYPNLFFIYSFLGHLLEKILNPNHASGILYGFWTPIYGVGSLIIVFINEFLMKKTKFKGITKAIILFFSSAIIISSIEYLGGYLIEAIFHVTFWDYSNKKFNIGKYTSLDMGLIWGVSSIVLIYIINPILEKKCKKIPKWVSYSLSILFIIDIIISISLRAK